MKNYFKAILFLIIIIQGCNKSEDENIELLPSPEYPFTYATLSQQEMAIELQKFNSFNTMESLTLNEFGILSGKLPIDLSSGLDSIIVKNNISFIVDIYADYMGITNVENIDIETDISIRLNGGVNVTLQDYFKYEQVAYPVFVLNQTKLKERNIENTEISFYFSETDNEMIISGRWYPEVFIPEEEIKNQDDALNITIQNINENHKDITPLNLSNVEIEKFNKVLFPFQSENGIEIRECWEVTIWGNSVQTLVDTQTGEIIYYLEYGHMI